MSEKKDTNPKDAVGTGKAPLSTVSGQVLAEVEAQLGLLPVRPFFETGVAMLEGALKYGRHNYRSAGVRASVYFDAVMRHRAARFCGQPIDPESGLPHMVKEIAGLCVLRDSMLQGNWVDDRPPPAKRNPNTGDLRSWWEGQDEFGRASVIVVEIARLALERELETKNERVDIWLPALNAHAKRLVEKYPNPPPAHVRAPTAAPEPTQNESYYCRGCNTLWSMDVCDMCGEVLS